MLDEPPSSPPPVKHYGKDLASFRHREAQFIYAAESEQPQQPSPKIVRAKKRLSASTRSGIHGAPALVEAPGKTPWWAVVTRGGGPRPVVALPGGSTNDHL